jgi:hypothetical protein
MATTTHFLQGYGTNGSSTAQFHDMLTVPANKIAKVKLTSLSVQNTTNGTEQYNWNAGLYVTPTGATTKVLIDAYNTPTSNAKSHYTIFPTDGRLGNSSTTVNVQTHVQQDDYANYSAWAANNNYGSQGFLNPEFYLNSGEILSFMWRQNNNQPDYQFFLRGFYLLEDISA